MTQENSGQKGHSILLGIITFGIIVRDSQSMLSTFFHHTTLVHYWQYTLLSWDAQQSDKLC